MARPPHLALAVAALAVVVVPLRSLHAFDGLRNVADLVTLTYVAQVVWLFVTVVGFAAVGYAYAVRSGEPPGRTFVVAWVAALVGVLAGNGVMVFSMDVSWSLSLPAMLGFVGTRAVLDAATFGLVTLGGFALGTGEPA